MMLQEFKPAFLFLGKFLGLYFLGNMLYGIYIESYGSRVDDVTYAVTKQSCRVLNILGGATNTIEHAAKPSVYIAEGMHTVISVFEGCNGLNVMIIFVAFIVAFGGAWKKMVWYIPFGLLIIHLTNLARITLLYYTARFYESYFYYVHKYFFTAILYVVVLVLWALWVKIQAANLQKRQSTDNAIQ